MPVRRDATKLLIHAGRGDRKAKEELVLLVYDELRALARKYLRRERSDHTLDPTALVHEAYMRLVDQRVTHWENRSHFYRIAARMMRRVLVDHARKRLARKRGGAARRRSITRIAELGIEEDADLLAIDEALEEFASFDPRKCRIVELRFFAGLSMERVAEALGVSLSTVERDWRMARLWLFKRLKTGREDGSRLVEEDRRALRRRIGDAAGGEESIP